MSIGILDTSVLIHLYRGHKAARAWFTEQTQSYSVTSTTWLELIDGAPSKAGQAACISILGQLDLVRLTEADQNWAME